ncbi:MAG: endonuclease III [Planctomycetota bacterium]|nr:MAG: endonuclease III [Planctomycetota bacterium]
MNRNTRPQKGQTSGLARPTAAVRRESASARSSRAKTLVQRLREAYPDAHCSLDFASPFQLVIATILSAQCTDKRVNMVTPELFRRWPDAATLAGAKQRDLEAVIRSTGFFRAKAKSLLGCARALVDRHGGEVPRTIEELVRLPGVGRKTANVVLGTAFGIASGVVVDTHVGRISRRLGLTRAADAVRAERDLVRVVPRENWIQFSHWLIEHGRGVCSARRPVCDDCSLLDLCPRVSVKLPGSR